MTIFLMVILSTVSLKTEDFRRSETNISVRKKQSSKTWVLSGSSELIKLIRQNKIFLIDIFSENILTL